MMNEEKLEKIRQKADRILEKFNEAFEKGLKEVQEKLREKDKALTILGKDLYKLPVMVTKMPGAFFYIVDDQDIQFVRGREYLYTKDWEMDEKKLFANCALADLETFLNKIDCEIEEMLNEEARKYEQRTSEYASLLQKMGAESGEIPDLSDVEEQEDAFPFDR